MWYHHFAQTSETVSTTAKLFICLQITDIINGAHAFITVRFPAQELLPGARSVYANVPDASEKTSMIWWVSGQISNMWNTTACMSDVLKSTQLNIPGSKYLCLPELCVCLRPTLQSTSLFVKWLIPGVQVNCETLHLLSDTSTQKRPVDLSVDRYGYNTGKLLICQSYTVNSLRVCMYTHFNMH